MKKVFDFLCVSLTAVLLTFSLAACSDDEGPDYDEINDYYSVITGVSGGGFTPQQNSDFTAQLNVKLELTSLAWKGISRSKAIYNAQEEVDDIAELLYVIQEPYKFGNGTVVYVDYELKQKDGSTVKTWRIELGRDYYQVH